MILFGTLKCLREAVKHEYACSTHSLTYALFNDAFISPDSISSDGKMIMKLQLMWNEMVVACSDVIFLHLAEGNEEDHDKPQSGWMVSEIRTEHKPETLLLGMVRCRFESRLRKRLYLLRVFVGCPRQVMG
jgi:hypothetical protein